MYVTHVRPDSPLVGGLLLDNEVVAVDGNDVRGMTAIKASALRMRGGKEHQHQEAGLEAVQGVVRRET